MDRQRRSEPVSEPRYPQDFVSQVEKRRGVQRRFWPAPENGDDIALQSHHMPDRGARWMKAGPGPYRQRPVDAPSQTTRGANRRRYAAWHGNSSWTGRQWRRRLAAGRARRHGRGGDSQEDNGRSGPHIFTIRRLRARAATSAVVSGSVLKVGDALPRQPTARHWRLTVPAPPASSALRDRFRSFRGPVRSAHPRRDSHPGRSVGSYPAGLRSRANVTADRAVLLGVVT